MLRRAHQVAIRIIVRICRTQENGTRACTQYTEREYVEGQRCVVILGAKTATKI